MSTLPGQFQFHPAFVPTPGNVRFRQAVGRLDGIVRGIMGERRRRSNGVADLRLTPRGVESGAWVRSGARACGTPRPGLE